LFASNRTAPHPCAADFGFRPAAVPREQRNDKGSDLLSEYEQTSCDLFEAVFEELRTAFYEAIGASSSGGHDIDAFGTELLRTA
jgi:hypothetical protein